MKLSHDYWYQYSDKSVTRSAHRQTIVRPSGLFLFDGEALSRDAQPVPVPVPLHSMTHSTVQTTQSFPIVVERDSALSRDRSKESVSSSQRHKSHYYSRLQFPENELEALQRRTERESTVRSLKHIYFDDNFLRHSSTDVKKPLEAARRLLLPSHARTEALRTTWEENREAPVRDDLAM